VAEFGQRGRFWGLCGRQNLAVAGVAGWQFCGRFATCQHLLSKNRLFLEKNPKIFKKFFDGMKFFQKLWHKNGIKKLPRAFFEIMPKKSIFRPIFLGKNSENFLKMARFYLINMLAVFVKSVADFGNSVAGKFGRFWN